LLCGKNFGAGFALHRLDMDVVAVVVVENQHVGVARAGWLDEAATEIGDELAGCGGAMGVDGMRAHRLDGWRVMVVGGGFAQGRRDWRGRKGRKGWR
jgi:hypothetical protein